MYNLFKVLFVQLSENYEAVRFFSMRLKGLSFLFAIIIDQFHTTLMWTMSPLYVISYSKYGIGHVVFCVLPPK